MPNPTCSQLTPLYRTWKDSLSELKEAMLKYQETGLLTDKLSFDDLISEVTRAEQAYKHEAYETLVEYRGKQLCQVESIVLTKIDELLVQGTGDASWITVNQGRLVALDVSNNTSSSITQALALTKYLSKLQKLYCSNTQLTSLPELPDTLEKLYCFNTQLTSLPELPDSLLHIDIQNTPAANDPQIQEQLDAFKASHPGAKVLF